MNDSQVKFPSGKRTELDETETFLSLLIFRRNNIESSDYKKHWIMKTCYCFAKKFLFFCSSYTMNIFSTVVRNEMTKNQEMYFLVICVDFGNRFTNTWPYTESRLFSWNNYVKLSKFGGTGGCLQNFCSLFDTIIVTELHFFNMTKNVWRKNLLVFVKTH